MGFVFSDCLLRTPNIVYRTDVGEVKHITLSRQNSIDLGTDALLRVRSTADHVAVELVKGEAFFIVGTEPRTPLFIQAANVEIRAMEARFDVRRESSDDLQVAVSQGDVELRSPIHTLIRDGQTAIISGNSEGIRIFSNTEINRKIAWMTGYLEYSGEALYDVVSDFNRFNRLKIVIDDTSIADLRIAGRFPYTDPRSFCLSLERVFGVRTDLIKTDRGQELHLRAPLRRT